MGLAANLAVGLTAIDRRLVGRRAIAACRDGPSCEALHIAIDRNVLAGDGTGER